MNIFKHVPTYPRKETHRTNKLKLILLSSLLLASQLNGVKIKFLDQSEPIEIDEQTLASISPTFLRCSSPINLNMTQPEFHRISEIIRNILRQISNPPLSIQAANEQLTMIIKQQAPNDIIAIKEISPLLNCDFLKKALTIIIQENQSSSHATIPPSTQRLIRRLKGTKSTRTTPYLQLNPSSLQELTLIHTEKDPHEIPMYPIISPSILDTIQESDSQNSETDTTPRALCIKPEYSEYIVIPMQMLREHTPYKEIYRFLDSYSLEKLHSALEEANSLKIKELINLLVLTIAIKLTNSEVLEEFKSDPEQFINKYYIFNVDGIREAIIKNIPSLYEMFELSGHSLKVTEIRMLSDGKFVTGSADQTAIIWIPTIYGTYSQLNKLSHPGEITEIAILGKNKIITICLDGTLSIWSPKNHNTNDYYLKLRDASTQTSCITVLPNKTFITGSMDGTIKIWRKNFNKIYSPIILINTGRPVTCLAAMTNKQIVTSYNSNEATVWDLNPLSDQYIPTQLIGHTKKINSIAITPTGGILTNDSHTIKIWTQNATGRYLSRDLFTKTDGTNCLKLLSNGYILSTDENNIITIGNITTSRDLNSLSFNFLGKYEGESFKSFCDGQIIASYQTNNAIAKIYYRIITSSLTLKQALFIRLCQNTPICLERNIQLSSIFYSLQIALQSKLLSWGYTNLEPIIRSYPTTIEAPIVAAKNKSCCTIL